MLNKEILIRNLDRELDGAYGGFADGINCAMKHIEQMEQLHHENVNPSYFLACLEEIETYGAVMTTRSSTSSRGVSLAFTKLQEARHWMEQDIRDRNAIQKAREVNEAKNRG